MPTPDSRPSTRQRSPLSGLPDRDRWPTRREESSRTGRGWNHPTRGSVLSDRFIPLAEQTGLIVPIGRWVLTEACRQVMRWRKEHPEHAPRSVAVNLSVRQLQDLKLLEDVADALSASGLEPAGLLLVGGAISLVAI